MSREGYNEVTIPTFILNDAADVIESTIIDLDLILDEADKIYVEGDDKMKNYRDKILSIAHDRRERCKDELKHLRNFYIETLNARRFK